MPAITVIHADGTRQRITAQVGESVMQAARNAGVEGIVADCGGEMACATCHIFARSHHDVLPSPSEMEDEMLDFTIVPREVHSRLSCQIKMSDELDSFEIELPEAQI